MDQALTGSSPLARLPIGILPGTPLTTPVKGHGADELLTKKEVCEGELDALSSPGSVDSSQLPLPEELRTDKELTDSESEKERPEIADWLKGVCGHVCYCIAS